jgi:acid phosphatase (class A)
MRAVITLFAVLAPWAGAHGQSRPAGFLDADERPDSLRIVPPPPREGTAAYRADIDAHRAMRALRDTPRWQLAAADANVRFPHAASIFACALGVQVTEADTPHLYRLLQRAMIDAGQSTVRAKDAYARERPLAVYDEPICVPNEASRLRKTASYPSGHAAAGWAWALILAELAPDRADEILRRGYEFGISRVVCGVHWLSDIEAGRTVGAAAVARLHADDEFRAELEHARRELARSRSDRSKPTETSCETESRALAATAGQ